VAGLFKWGRQASDAPAAPVAALSPAETLVRSKVLPRFLAAVAQQSSPVLLDLGPVVGSNIAFFGDRLACKIHVADVFAEIESCAKLGDRAACADAILSRMTYGPGSVDGILCWDAFDFLDRRSSQALAARLAEMLRRGGALLGSFGTKAVELRHYTRFAVESEATLRARAYPATPLTRPVLVTRDIDKMFHTLRVTDTVLLKSGAREMLFRKP
jgi:hypothetical protein